MASMPGSGFMLFTTPSGPLAMALTVRGSRLGVPGGLVSLGPRLAGENARNHRRVTEPSQ
jgi:hypothetical protein